MFYNADSLEEQALASVPDAGPFLAREGGVVWLNVRGEPDEEMLRDLGELFHLHPLALEDINAPQRPKAEEYEEQDFIITHTIREGAEDRLEFGQFSFFVGDKYVLSFEREQDAIGEQVQNRIRQARGMIRQHGVDHLMYALLDTVIDSYFPILEDFGEYLEYVQERALLQEQPTIMRDIQRAKHELLHLRRSVWPQRDLLSVLMRDDNNSVSPPVRHYLRDCYDHVVQLMDMVETYREMSGDLMEAYLSAASNRMNSIMKVLTVIATLFMPLTFIVGLYGMNFNTKASSWNMPELNWPHGYAMTWTVMITVVVVMLAWFRRRGWLGRPDLPRPEDLQEAEQPAKRKRQNPPGG